jgi:serine/threonine protein kinase
MARFANTMKLGSGGFGEVWLCAREEDGGIFARKQLLYELDEDGISRFQREVRILSRLDHPNIVKVIGFHLQKAPYWYVMPRYGHTLAREVPSLIGNTQRIIPIFSAILSGMEYAHSEGVIHRDLKPENVLMNDDYDVVVTDFGLGRKLDSDSTRHTITGLSMGTFLYMAPEQMTNAKNADARSDIYSLGRILLELFTGQLAPSATDTSSLDSGVAHVIEKCTKTDPKRRYQSVADLRNELFAVLGVTQASSPYEEITSIIGKLVSTTKPDRRTAERLLDLLAQNRSDTDMIHEVIMKIPKESASLLLDIDKEETRTLIDAFVSHCTSQSWGFSYTDNIGAQCNRLYCALPDPQIRAALIHCVMDVGFGHNRWYVMGIFDDLMAKKHEMAEHLAFADMFEKVSVDLRDWARDRLTNAKLHPAVAAALNKPRVDAE